MPSLSITLLIVASTCLVSLLFMQNQRVKTRLLFRPAAIRQRREWYRFLSSGLIHADGFHLAINMFVFWSFGTVLEQYYYPEFLGEFAALKFVVLYVGGIVVASLPDYFRHSRNPDYAALGASGGVAAVVFAVILFDPWQNLYVYGVLPIPQVLAGAAYLFYSWYADKRSSARIAHMAHFAGALWGVAFTVAMRPDLLVTFVTRTLQGPNW